MRTKPTRTAALPVVACLAVNRLPEPDYSALRAIDPRTGAMRWEYKFPTATLAGVISTASGLVFAGDNEGNFNAFDSRGGKRLWYYRTGSPIWGGAVRQHARRVRGT